VAAQSPAGATQAAPQSRVDTIAKPVPARHKRGIIVSRGKEDQQKLDRTGKELTEQLNGTGVAGEVAGSPAETWS
jgi:hypothetical protein